MVVRVVGVRELRSCRALSWRQLAGARELCAMTFMSQGGLFVVASHKGHANFPCCCLLFSRPVSTTPKSAGHPAAFAQPACVFSSA